MTRITNYIAMYNVKLFHTPHRALRFALSKLVVNAGSTDPNVLQNLAELKSLAIEVFALIKSHSYHEDEICFAALDLIAPGNTEHDRLEHQRLHEKLDALIELFDHLSEIENQEDQTEFYWREIYCRICKLNEEMFIHMREEEELTEPIFHKNLSEQELIDFSPRILSSMDPQTAAMWNKYILPSHTQAERDAILAFFSSFSKKQGEGFLVAMANQIPF